MDMSTDNTTASGANVTNTVANTNENMAPAIVQFSIGLFGNIAALVILIRSSTEHKWRPFYRLLGGLIVSDLSAMTLAYPFIISAYISNFTIIFPTAVCGFMSFILTFVVITSAFTVCAMSFDRFLAVIFPLTYSNLSTFRVNLTLIGIWILTAIISSLPLIGFGSFRVFYPGSWCFFDFTSDDAGDKAFTYFYAVFGLLIIVSTITLNATVIFALCWKFYSRKRRSTKGKRNDVFIIIYILAIVILFVVCTTPLMIRMLMHAIKGDLYDEKADLLAGWLSVANFIIDPWIYLLFKRTTFNLIGRLARSLVRRFRTRLIEGEGESSEVTNRQDHSDRTDDTNLLDFYRADNDTYA